MSSNDASNSCDLNNPSLSKNSLSQNSEQHLMLLRNNLQSTTNQENLLPNQPQTERLVNRNVESREILNQHQQNCDSTSSSLTQIAKKHNFTILSKDRSLDSSQDEEHNFSELLNLSVCIPSVLNQLPLENIPGGHSTIPQELQQSFSVTNSVTSSDVSSLANLGTPDSPPRATSPTVEMRELLDKIQQLPQQKSPLPETPQHLSQAKSRSYFHRTKAKTLYMPLNEVVIKSQTKTSPTGRPGVFGASTSIFYKGTKSWLSRSAPNTPSGNFVPSFPQQKKNSTNQKSGSKSKISDGSPLLNGNESDDEAHKDERL